MLRFPSRWASGRLVANKYFREIKAPQSSISVKKGMSHKMGPPLNNSLKEEETFFSTFKADPKAFKAIDNDLSKLRCFF